jgi:hypothetical protein
MNPIFDEGRLACRRLRLGDLSLVMWEDQIQTASVKIASNGTISTFAGTGTIGSSGDGGPAAKALFSGPTGLALDAIGNLYIADAGNNRVRMISPDGTIKGGEPTVDPQLLKRFYEQMVYGRVFDEKAPTSPP